MPFKLFAPILIATNLFLVASCKKYNAQNVQQADIKQYYTLTYIAGNNTTIAEARFSLRNGGALNTVRLNGNAQVKFNNMAMAYSNGYRLQLNGNHLADTFTFTNHNNNTFKNVGAIILPINVPFSYGFTMYKSVGYNINVPFLFSSSNNGYISLWLANNIYHATSNGSLTTIYLSPSTLSPISEGYYFANLSRTLTNSLAQSTAGGTITTRYLSNYFGVDVIDR